MERTVESFRGDRFGRLLPLICAVGLLSLLVEVVYQDYFLVVRDKNPRLNLEEVR
jgi:hypothetical protein